jgi:hypothetical protein
MGYIQNIVRNTRSRNELKVSDLNNTIINKINKLTHLVVRMEPHIMYAAGPRQHSYSWFRA